MIHIVIYLLSLKLTSQISFVNHTIIPLDTQQQKYIIINRSLIHYQDDDFLNNEIPIFTAVISQTEFDFGCLTSCLMEIGDNCTEPIQLSGKCSGVIAYDNEATLSGSEHLIEIPGWGKIFLYVGYIQGPPNQSVDVSVEFVSSRIIVEKSNCIQKPNLPIYDDEVQWFGSRCQLSLQRAQLNKGIWMVLREQQWIYWVVDTKLKEPLRLRVDDGLSSLVLSFSEWVPNYYYEKYIVKGGLINIYKQQQKERTTQKYTIQPHVHSNSTLFYIGFFNPHNYPLQIYGVVYNINNDDYDLEYILKLSILVIASSILIISLVILFRVWVGRTAESGTIIQQQQGIDVVIIHRQRMKPIQKGFKLQFLRQYYQPFFYNSLILKYPKLSEIQECAICLETMKPNSSDSDRFEDFMHQDLQIPFENLHQQLELSMSKRANTGELYHCSVTACFHVFHYVCLLEWFQNQKFCPVCRTEYSEAQLKKKVQINILPDILAMSQRQNLNEQHYAYIDSGQSNPYIMRMKTRNSDTQMTQITQINNVSPIRIPATKALLNQ